MSRNPWRSLLRPFKMQVAPQRIPVPRPTRADFDAFETQTGFRLPASYRDFVSLLGPGQLAGEFTIYAPGCKENPHADLLMFVRERQESFAERGGDLLLWGYANPDRLRRLV